MRGVKRPAVYIASVVALTFSAGGSAAHEWSAYVNSRYGVRISYPSSVFAFERASARGDGEIYRSRDGRAQLLIGVVPNIEGFSPRSYQRFLARNSYPGAEIDYAPVGSNWTVLSGERGPTMFYEKVFFRCQGAMIGSFAMLYPVAERATYDPIIERMEDSFRIGSEACSQLG